MTEKVLPIIQKNGLAGIRTLTNYGKNKLRRIVLDSYTFDPLMATYYVTHRCNLSCLYCTEKYPDKITQEVGTEDAKRIIDFIRRDCSMIYFTGGEPLVRPDIIELVQHASKVGFYPIYFHTNGLLLPRREAILEYVDQLLISLDSLNTSRWDHILNAGRGKAQRIIDIVQQYAEQQQERDYSILINCVITPESIQDVYHVLDFCERNNLRFSAVSALDENEPKLWLRDDPEYRKLVDHLLERKRRGARIIGSVESLRTLLLFEPFTCYATLIPRIYPDGSVLYPCLPMGRVGGNILKTGSIKGAYREGMRKHGAWKKCPRECHLFGYVNTYFYLDHFWDTAKESVGQYIL